MANPCPLSAKYEGSFAYYTVKDRMPQIVSKVVDNVHRHHKWFLENHGEEGVVASKKALSMFSKLLHEVKTNKPIEELTDDRPDTPLWNQYVEYQRSLLKEGDKLCWVRSPLLFVECYLYRKIQEGFSLSPPVCDYDVFREAKYTNFSKSMPAIWSLCDNLYHSRKKMSKLNNCEARCEFYRLLQVCLWANRCDLSISGGQENFQESNILHTLVSLKPYILVDDIVQVWAILARIRETHTASKIRVDIVIDNAGFELVTNLILAEVMMTLKLATEIHFHGKVMPWFFSDATKHDFDWTIQQLLATRNKCMTKFAQTWKDNLKKGCWVYHEHLFWTLPHEYRRMAEVAPDLYAELHKSDLVFFIGDLNYRKLTGDLQWDFNTPIRQVLRYFKAPLCCVRTIKSEVVVGLEDGVGEEFTEDDPDWMTNGKYGVIQFSDPV